MFYGSKIFKLLGFIKKDISLASRGLYSLLEKKVVYFFNAPQKRGAFKNVRGRIQKTIKRYLISIVIFCCQCTKYILA